jgi:hypothetical protein
MEIKRLKLKNTPQVSSLICVGTNKTIYGEIEGNIRIKRQKEMSKGSHEERC